MKPLFYLFSSLFVAALLAHPAQAELRVPAMFSDQMILQREIAAPIWGTGTAGETITVEFAGQSKTASVAPDGKWSLKLDPLPASAEGRELVIKSSDKTLKIQNVLVGDVWLASGQSNMDSPLSSGSAAEALPTANDPLLRFFKVTKTVAVEPLFEPKGQWELTTPETAKNFSAVAYFYAREIRRTQNVPVAVFNAAWGGTPIQTWMSLESIKRPPVLPKLPELWDTALAKHLAVKDRPELMTAYRTDMKDWETNVGPAHKAALAAHSELASAARAAGQPVPPAPKIARPEPEQPDPMAHPASSKRPSTPTIAYNGMIAPLAPYGLRGVLWYQGEADGSRGADYRYWFPRLIEGWRAAWGQGDFPFLFVQLPGCYDDKIPVATAGWAFLREAQASALALPATGMVVTSDIGDPKEVHPDNKLHVGTRMALLGRQLAHGEKVPGSAPRFVSHAVANAAIRISFSGAESGLVIGSAPWVSKIAQPLPTDRLVGFYIAGEDRKWVEAEARIEGDSVIVSAPSVPAPVAVRYSWANFPRANLYTKDGLPAAPFRTDDWP